MMMRAFLLLGVALLGGCAGGSTLPLGGDKEVKHLPAYQKDMQVARFGDWFIEPGTCEIDSTTADFDASTDGLMSNGTITVKMVFRSQLVRPPAATLTGLPVNVPVEGAKKVYSVIVAYDPTTAAHMLSPYTYLGIQYELLADGQTREANMGTRGLILALGALAKTCK